jgi:hypothetical protein
VLERKVPPCKKPKPEPYSVLLGLIPPRLLMTKKVIRFQQNEKKFGKGRKDSAGTIPDVRWLCVER